MDATHNDYTEEQLSYVNSIPDDVALLRGHLLHQVRLRDSMEKDRNAGEEKFNKLLNSKKQDAMAFAIHLNSINENKYDPVYIERVYELYQQSKSTNI